MSHLITRDDESKYLIHHGIKGQKWGVRRFQNEDGSLTPDGRQRYRERNNVIKGRKYTDDINDVVRSLPTSEKHKLGSYDDDWVSKDQEDEILSYQIARFVKKVDDVPVSFVELWRYNENSAQLAVATRSGKEYRGKGYASELVDQAIKYVERYQKKNVNELYWFARVDNAPSRNLAKKKGFKFDKYEKSEHSSKGEENKYAKYVKYIK